MWKPIKPPFRKFKTLQAVRRLYSFNYIYQLGESSILREKSSPVKTSEIRSPEFKKKINYLKRCLRRYRKETGVGRGLAAVQIGIPERFSVVYMPEAKNKFLIIVNPKVTGKSTQKLLYPEMCMSANPTIAYVIRPAWIEFEYYDEFGVKQCWDTKAGSESDMMYNRVFQHEIDHLDGIVNIDLVEPKNIILESNPSFYVGAKFEKI